MIELKNDLPQPLLSMKELARVANAEARKRAQVYPRLVERGKLTQQRAERELAAMNQIGALLHLNAKYGHGASVDGAEPCDLWEAARDLGMPTDDDLFTTQPQTA